MNREQLLHAIRASAQIVGLDRVIVIGSQSILATWSEDELPRAATFSREADILPHPEADLDSLRLSSADIRRLAERLDAIGEMSQFDQTHGYHVDGVDETTAVLPSGWEQRLIVLETHSVALGRDVQGLCLDPHDLCVAKLVAFRRKDREFVGALVEAGLIDADSLIDRLSATSPPDGRDLDYAYSWLIDRSTRG